MYVEPLAGMADDLKFVSLKDNSLSGDLSPIASLRMLEELRLARNCLDVFRSQNRVMPHRGGWTCVAGRTKELRKYRLRAELAPHFDGRDMLCTIKQNVWKRYQRPLLERRVATELTSAGAGGKPPLLATVEFDSFRTHPMWTGSEQRATGRHHRATGGISIVGRCP